MITYEELMGTDGLIKKYLPGEYDCNTDKAEGHFLANLCLYLLIPVTENPNSWYFFKDKNDRTFLKHFVFHNIPEKDFRDEISKKTEAEDQVRIILDKIKTTILKSKEGMRFHDFYVLGFKNLIDYTGKDANENQKILYCENMCKIYEAEKFPNNWCPPTDWNDFTEKCKKNNIPLNQKSSKDKESFPRNVAVGALRAILESYLHDRTEKRDTKTNETKEYFHSTIFKAFQKSFTEKKGAVEALRDALDGKTTDLNKHLAVLRDGNLGKKLRAFIKHGRANPIVGGQEVNTVTDFVHALHTQVNKTENTPN